MHASLTYKIADGILEGSKEKPFNEQDYLIENEDVDVSTLVAATIEKAKTVAPPNANSELKRLLTDYRTKKAKQSEVKPYHIFSNKTLDELLEKNATDY